MVKKTNGTPDASSPPVVPRNRMEIIRFRTKEESRQAMGVFYRTASPEIYFTFRKEWPEGTCVTNTATVRALQAMGCTFEWLTENLEPLPL